MEPVCPVEPGNSVATLRDSFVAMYHVEFLKSILYVCVCMYVYVYVYKYVYVYA